VLSESENAMKKFHRLMDAWIDRRDYQGNPITLVHVLCLAHKVQLISRGSIIPSKSELDDGGGGTSNSLLYFSVFENEMIFYHPLSLLICLMMYLKF
jgi:hypothetical protein